MSVEQLIKSRQITLMNEMPQSFGDNKISDATGKINEQKIYLLRNVQEKLVQAYSSINIDNKEKYNEIRQEAWVMIQEETEKNDYYIYLDSYDKAEILELLMQTMFGYGVIDSLIKDPSINEIMVNGLEKIFIEKNGVIEQAKNGRGEYLRFYSNGELYCVIEKIVAPINRKVDESNPIVDARLPNGFRVNIVLNPISLDGHIITIRKFPESPFTMDKLVEFGTLPLEAAVFLEKMVKAKYNIIISGGTGSGKTTFLNALSNYIEKNSRIITIEDAAELKLSNINNLIRLETRPPNIEGKGEINVRDLLKSALRMRPDRIIVGEVRGGEALDMLQAMNTGHDGSLSTGHANSANDMLSRLETMVLMAGVELPLLSIRQQIASAVEVIVHLSKIQNGKRQVTQITEILGVGPEGYITQNLFELKTDHALNDDIEQLKCTGKKMKRTNKFIHTKINMDELLA